MFLFKSNAYNHQVYNSNADLRIDIAAHLLKLYDFLKRHHSIAFKVEIPMIKMWMD